MRRIVVVLVATAIVTALIVMAGAGPAVAQKGKAKAKAAQQPTPPQTGGIPVAAVIAPAALGAGVLAVGGGMLLRRRIR